MLDSRPFHGYAVRRRRAHHRSRSHRPDGNPGGTAQGARHVVITGMNPFRLDLARKMGATLAVDPSETPLAEVQKQLGMEEGFDVGLDQRVWLAFLDVDGTLTSAAK